jgi:hypothetical protein
MLSQLDPLYRRRIRQARRAGLIAGMAIMACGGTVAMLILVVAAAP